MVAPQQPQQDPTPFYQRMEVLFLAAGVVVLILIFALYLNGTQVVSDWWTAAGALLVAAGVVYSPSKG